MEILLVTFALIVISSFFFYKVFSRSETSADVEAAIRWGDVKALEALLLVRGRHLTRTTRKHAEEWLKARKES